ncbi:TIGR01621 family pseudouridine synthase [Idiomarina xiamenensis]|uniref:Pseudouridine synthase n=1 Tax=Idiomarina xiamenensis 10-D-4 TaxID=740709 RepID=K2KPS3_9GAMM|nr:TIGR01621 family pseudouridine synthase [Idiomarina xiamenensis]EKE84464.1 pseudouridine synthase [Idiomarina xiamenensis 10-D-4]
MSIEHSILHQHRDFYVVDKPAGIGMHSDQGAGLMVQLSEQLKQPLWPVHRLDKDTSGLLLVARNADAAASLSQLFAKQQVSKIYLAVASGKPKKKQGWIQGGMRKSRNGNWILSRDREHFARTQFFSYHLDIGERLYLLRPFSGRTHQLRVALKSLSCPITGDRRYGGATASRMLLHAYALRFSWQQQMITLTSEVAAVDSFSKLTDSTDEIRQALAQPFDLKWITP